MPSYAEILSGSEYLSNVQKLYGWSIEIAARSLGSMADSLKTLQDWRIDNIMLKNHEYSLNVCNSGLALEVGFGTGSFTVVARKRGINIIGIDYTAEYMRVARALGSTAGFADEELNYIFRQGNAEDMPFPDNHFALILSSGVVQFIWDLVAAMREMIRTLKPGGILLLDAPDYRFPFEAQYNIPWIPFMKKELAKVWLEGFEKPHKGLDYIRYVSLPHCLGIMKAVGFSIIEARTTIPETDIPRQIDQVLLGDPSLNYLLNDPVRISLLAREVSRRNINTPRAAFIITAQKPFESTYPGCF